MVNLVDVDSTDFTFIIVKSFLNPMKYLIYDTPY